MEDGEPATVIATTGERIAASGSETEQHPDELYKSELDRHLWTLADELRASNRDSGRGDPDYGEAIDDEDDEDQPAVGEDDTAANQVYRVWSWLQDMISSGPSHESQPE